MLSPLFTEVWGIRREGVWRKLAAEIGGDFIDGGFWAAHRVELSHGGSQITLQLVPLGRTQATQIAASFVSRDGFRFRVYRKEIFSELGKMLGMQDVDVGHAEFDQNFVIQGTDERKLRQLFGNARIRELIAAQPKIHFAVIGPPGILGRDIFSQPPPENAFALQFILAGVIKDKERLRLLFDLFAETLDELGRMGSVEAGAASVLERGRS